MNEPVFAQHCIKGVDDYYYYSPPEGWNFSARALREIAAYLDKKNKDKLDEARWGR